MCWHHTGWSPLSRGARLAAPAIAVLLTMLGGGLAPATSALGPVEQAGTPAVGLTPVFTGLERPVFVTHAGDGTNRLFVVEQPGRIRVAVNGVLLATPFLDIATLVASDPVRAAEQGLLGLAFHPQYATNGRFYVYYTAKPNGANRLVRYRVSADPNRADDSTALELFSIPDRFTNHNGGMLAFGPDGLLYVGTGDGGSGGDPDNNAQSLGSLLGKLLRLDVTTAEPYAIPTSNPFVNTAGARPEIWAYGLRNPWRFSFDRGTGDLYLGDVGQGTYEEIDWQPAGSSGGQNYGWRIMEGLHCFNPNPCSMNGLTLPVFEYNHSDGNCSVTGGYVYRGPTLAALSGAYVFGDYCAGTIWSLRRDAGGAWVRTLLLDTSLLLVSFGEDQAGELYVADQAGNAVYRVVDGPATPTPTRTTTPIRTPTPSPTLAATATATATPAPPSCVPRPAVGLSVSPSGTSRLQVTVTANSNPAGGSNRLREIHFGAATNALVDLPDGRSGLPGGITVSLPAGTSSYVFHVRQATPGGYSTVPLGVVDGCGEWPTFVGGGPSAF